MKMHKCGFLPTRATIGCMILTACLFCYMLRVNMSINLIAMVQSSGGGDGTVNSSSECLAINGKPMNETEFHQRQTSLPDYGTRYDWDGNIQGLILGSFFWGYIVSSMPGGLLAEKFGPSRVILIAMVSSGILTILTPLAASIHYGVVTGLRVCLGVVGGLIYPALHSLIARWSPPEEKGKFIGALMGGTLGTVITWPMLGPIIENLGWAWAFFIPGILTLLWCVLWYFLVTDSPEVHPRITDAEKIFILKSIGGQAVTTTVKGIPPYKDIFLSVPFWALAVLHFGSCWGLYLLLTSGPKFMADVMGFNLGNSGTLAALPYLLRLIFGFVFGSIGDRIRKSGRMSVTTIRKAFILFSHGFPGLFLIAQTLIGCDPVWAVTFIVLALGMNGASTITNLQNSQDLSTKYPGTIYGIINCIGGATGFVTPMLVGYITAKHNGLKEWHVIFWIGAAIYIVSGLVFIVFGSGQMQEWNGEKKIEDGNNEKVKDSSLRRGIDNQAYSLDTEQENGKNVTFSDSNGKNIEITKV